MCGYLFGVGCMWRVGACACDVTREKDREREKERGVRILHGTELLMFHAFRCCMCFIRMLYVFHLDVAYVAMAIHVCCKYMFHLF